MQIITSVKMGGLGDVVFQVMIDGRGLAHLSMSCMEGIGPEVVCVLTVSELKGALESAIAGLDVYEDKRIADLLKKKGD